MLGSRRTTPHDAQGAAAPTNAELLRAGLEFLPNDVREDFGSYLYWNAELQA
jgi:hypothetical protein